MISTDTYANVIHDGGESHERAQRATETSRSVALACTWIYLALSGVVLWLGGHVWLALIHAAVMELARRTWKPKNRSARIAGDLLPLVLFPVLYFEIPFLIAALGTAYRDSAVQGWEMAAFGTQLSQTLPGVLPFPWLSEFLHAGYLAYYPVIFLPPVLLYARGERRGFAQTVAALAITFGVCWTAFALFPVQGPRYLFAPPPGIPIGPVRRFALWVLASGSARGAAFPSSHMAVSVAQTLMAWRWQPRTARVLAPATVLIGAGAVYGGFHYAVDIIAGAVLGVAVATVVLCAFPRNAAGR